MAQLYNNEGERDKQYIKIFKFYIKKKTLLMLGIAFIGIMLYSAYSSSVKEKEMQERQLEAQRRLAAANSQVDAPDNMSQAERIQAMLREEYGNPPEGFEWSYSGELIPLSTDDLFYEDVVYTYIRSLSILDFATAQRVASTSYVMDTYNDFYGVSTQVLADYYNNFLRKQFKVSLESLEVESIEDVAIFADGDAVLTVKIKCLDLTNKDFWQKDKDEMFDMMRFFDETEMDSIKKDSYVYDYIYNAYLGDTIGKRTVSVDLVVCKKNGGGWLVSDDSELKAALCYESGVDVAAYIAKLYDEWYRETVLEENKQAISQKLDEANNNSVAKEEVVEPVPTEEPKPTETSQPIETPSTGNETTQQSSETPVQTQPTTQPSSGVSDAPVHSVPDDEYHRKLEENLSHTTDSGIIGI